MAVTLKPLAEQTLVITGASSGIGLATARRAAREGANVVLVARNEEALREATEEIERRGGKAAYVAADIADEDAPQRIAAVATERFGGFDTWVNDAAAALYARLTDISMEEHRRVFDVGYFGLVNASLFAVGQLRERGGALINVGSVLGDRAVLVQGAYCAMKHAVKGFTEALRMECENDGLPISITLIKPHGIDTPYPEHARNKMDDPARIPPILYDPELVAKAICFAAANPRRDLLVGGQGIALTTLSNMFPRVADFGMELLMDEKGQSIDQPPEPGTKDNLFEPRKDGRERSNQDVFVRKTSLALEAQMHPLTTTMLGLGGAMLGAASAGLLGNGKRGRNTAGLMLGLGTAGVLGAIGFGERLFGAGRDAAQDTDSQAAKEQNRMDTPSTSADPHANPLFQQEAAAGIADENIVPAAGMAVPPEPRLDPAPYQPELRAGIADENAVPSEPNPTSAAHPS